LLLVEELKVVFSVSK